ncbi:MAG: hypothetical protein JXA69_15630, partial [Phycisphaerae bacterium]|nr:hypothetical protein [Phycisphaerae bacterium]
MAGPVQVSPVLWVQFRLSGGWRNALLVLCGYGVLLAVLAVFTFHGPIKVSSKTVASGWLITMNMIQTGLLVLVGTGAVRRAILQDFTTGLFDSHRLTPMTGPAAVLGYMIGPNVGPLMFLGINAAAGLVLCPMCGHPIPEWLLGIGFELMFALLLWAFAAVSALGTQGSAKLVVLILFLAAVGGWAIIVLVPGIGLLALGVLAAMLNLMPGIAGTMMPGTSLATLTLAAQGVLGAILFWAAVRKYRRPDLRAFPIWLALALVGSQAVMGGVGIHLWSRRPRALNEFPSPDVFTQIVATLAVL